MRRLHVRLPCIAGQLLCLLTLTTILSRISAVCSDTTDVFEVRVTMVNEVRFDLECRMTTENAKVTSNIVHSLVVVENHILSQYSAYPCRQPPIPVSSIPMRYLLQLQLVLNVH